MKITSPDARPATPLPVIAEVSRVVTLVVDQVSGDRVDFPLLVAAATVEALKVFGIESRVMYGQAAWIEILEDQSVIWAGCWGKNIHFWVATQHGEVVDLNTSVAYRKRVHSAPDHRAIYSPPMLWSTDVPRFYRYIPEGVAELDLLEDRDKKLFERVVSEVREKCMPAARAGLREPAASAFPDEAILCPERQLLDDSQDSFKKFDRAIGVGGIPPAPF
ncbi:MAG TPA: hypothetical protein VM598_08605 [Bdellovibrionota bacterium]|nr:hypothetical protein [Bdellovibrionota bacterium]